MSIDTIERKYNSISVESQTLEDILLKLTDIVRELLNTLEKTQPVGELKEKTESLLSKINQEHASTINREKIDSYLKTVKGLLNEAKKIGSEEVKKQDSQSLDEDINIIEEILREEIPEMPLLRSETKTASVETPKETKVERKIELSEESDIREEMKKLQEYVKMLSDKMFEIGEELLDLKERVMKIEQIIKPEAATMIPVAEPEPAEKVIEEMPEEHSEIKELMDEAREILSNPDENELARGIKMEAIKIRMEDKLPDLDRFPSKVKNEYESLLNEINSATAKLRKKILVYSSQHI